MSERNGRTRIRAHSHDAFLLMFVCMLFHCFLFGFIHAFRLLNPSRIPPRRCTLVFGAQEVDICDEDIWKEDRTARATFATNSEAYAPNVKGSIASSSIKEKIQQLKQSVDILTVLESYSLPQFRRTGPDRATAICPFHEDRHPSLSMDASKQIYKCFSCGAGGDVIHFVQEYSKLPIWQPQPELSFVQAARYVDTKFGTGDLFGAGNWTHSNVVSTHKKERIFLANAYAASFYSNCFQQPFAGGARYHVRTRGLSVPTIRTFAIGYAPDAYWDGRGASRKGQGSLVEHLLSVGVSAREMLDSGLVVLDNSAMLRGLSNRTQDVVQSTGDEVDPSLLVDRFRNRIMVPIWDESGSQILGFGGRIVPPPEADGDDPEYHPQQQRGFKTAKYLNSPESDVFVKRKILFGQHLAKSALQKFAGRKELTPPLLIVEGYMDAMTLWNAGIYNVVASMGTAISLEQLELAARTAGTRGGRIVLCLDNDEAGRMAVERLCGNGIISECIAKHAVAVLVGQLPGNIQDPADFIEYQRKQGLDAQRAVDRFLFDVVNAAIDWTEWFIQQLICGYDRNAPSGTAGSFSIVFERIADFLASSLGPAERTKRAFEVAGQLSHILANEQNSTDISVSVRIQLESDLIDLASRLAMSKQAIQRRVAETSSDASIEDPLAVASLVRGHGPSSDDHLNKLSKNATRTIASIDRAQTFTRKGSKSNPIRDVHSAGKSSNSHRPIKTTRAKLKREPDGVSLTAHFTGFRFVHQSDMDWLGLRDNKVNTGSHLCMIERVSPLRILTLPL
jgi:DNA primase catalytic core